jgi:hypothetical protein
MKMLWIRPSPTVSSLAPRLSNYRKTALEAVDSKYLVAVFTGMVVSPSKNLHHQDSDL